MSNKRKKRSKRNRYPKTVSSDVTSYSEIVSSDVTSSSAGAIPDPQQVREWSSENVKRFLRENITKLELDHEDIDYLYDQRIDGTKFLELTDQRLIKLLNIRYGPAMNIVELIKEIQGSQKQKLESPLFTSILDVVIEIKSRDKLPEFLQDDIKKQDVDKEEPLISNSIISHKDGGVLAVVRGSALYIRKAYEDLYHIVTKKNWDPRFLISGTSGVGKSCFLIYLLIRLLCNKPNVAIVFKPMPNDKNNLLCCFEGTKLRVGSFEDFSEQLYNPETWYLVDGTAPEDYVKAITVVTASSKSINSIELKEFVKELDNIFCMPPWSIEELEICRNNVFPMVPQDLMLDLIDVAGGVPRYVLRMPAKIIRNDNPQVQDFRDPPELKNRNSIIERSLKRVTESIQEVKNVTRLVQCLSEDARYVELSSHLIHRWPDTSYREKYLSWASNYIFDQIQEKLDTDRWNKLFREIQDPDDPSSSRGIIFESYVHYLFKVGDLKFEVRSLPKDQNDSIVESEFYIPKDPKRGYIRQAIHLKDCNDEEVVIKPTIKNFGAADLILTPKAIFQVTVSQSHPVKHSELVNIVQNMLAYRKDPDAVIYLYFIVPDDIYDTFRHQKYITPKKKIGNDLETFQEIVRESPFISRVEQWALKVKMTPDLNSCI